MGKLKFQLGDLVHSYYSGRIARIKEYDKAIKGYIVYEFAWGSNRDVKLTHIPSRRYNEFHIAPQEEISRHLNANPYVPSYKKGLKNIAIKVKHNDTNEVPRLIREISAAIVLYGEAGISNIFEREDVKKEFPSLETLNRFPIDNNYREFDFG